MPDSSTNEILMCRYEREERLARRVISQLKKHGIDASYVGTRISFRKPRLQPVDLVIENRLLALVRIDRHLSARDRVFVGMHPSTMVFSGPMDVLAALPAINGRLAAGECSALAALLVDAERINSI